MVGSFGAARADARGQAIERLRPLQMTTALALVPLIRRTDVAVRELLRQLYRELDEGRDVCQKLLVRRAHGIARGLGLRCAPAQFLHLGMAVRAHLGAM